MEATGEQDVATIQKDATVTEVSSSERGPRTDTLLEIQKLGLDSRSAIVASAVNDDRMLELVNAAMLQRAVADTQSALGLQDWYKFDPRTGNPLPELKREQIRFSDGSVLEGGIDKASYRERLAAIKEMLGERVQEAQAKGAKLPAVDPLTGQSVTQDSLAAYDAIFNPDRWHTRETSKPVTIQVQPGLTAIQGGPVPPDSGPVTMVRTQPVTVGAK